MTAPSRLGAAPILLATSIIFSQAGAKRLGGWGVLYHAPAQVALDDVQSYGSAHARTAGTTCLTISSLSACISTKVDDTKSQTVRQPLPRKGTGTTTGGFNSHVASASTHADSTVAQAGSASISALPVPARCTPGIATRPCPPPPELGALEAL
eukprot:CAMPEP_0179921808 /NCGR_PEP_ID=MMETSP0983-20121128/5268_1 /TAXON_ID=483367 /ORGANISM="non described non described, Strain CCMP 2436" /LENGTH=152 /DNA_ID=CAMNT_0021825043 /DNA_START=168 /DNA_END=628 /DNA_ORIENTATION=-